MPSHPMSGDHRLLEQLTNMAARAAAAILAMAPAALDPRLKADQSPVTAADEAAEAVILEGLERLLPGVAVVSEEAAVRPTALPSCFVLVDALDGTREFLAGRPEFTVNIALIADGSTVMGVVAGPALGRLWRGVVGRGAERLVLAKDAVAEPIAIHARRAPADGWVVAVSRSHGDAQTESLLGRLPVKERTTLGSSAKFCLVAEGSADLYARLAPTNEWDIAAGHAVVVAAGGIVTTPDGGAIRYGGAQQGFRVPAFLAWGDADAARRYGG